MTPETKARFVAAFAFPLLLLQAPSAHGQAPAPAGHVDPGVTPLPHISISTAGHGSPVVLIPGLSSPRAVWDATAARLSASHRVILVQVNGFGGDDPRANLSPGLLDGVVADLDGYLGRERIAAPAVIGHSMGGLVGLMLARAHPRDVGRLMLVDTLPWYGMLFGPGATVAAAEPQARALRDRLAGAYGTPMPEAAAEATASALALKPASRAMVAGWAKAADPRVTGEALYEDVMTDLRPALAAMPVPVTLVYPTSAARPAAAADPLYRGAYAAVPRMTYAPIDDSGHFAMLDQPAAFAAAVDAFLR